MPSDAALSGIAPYASYFSRDGEAVAADLERYFALLREWQRVQNLVSRETLPEFWSRHAADSLQVLKLLGPEPSRLLDLGSGAGLPLVPLAIATKGADRSFVAIEPNQRKVAFLRAVSRELQLGIQVESMRGEEIDSRETILPDVITSRALAPLSTLLGLAAPLFGPRTRAIFHKGREHVEELAESRALWHFDVVIVASDTSTDSALLEIRELRAKTNA